MAPSRLVNRNVRAGSGRTSMRLEPEFWDALAEICDRERRDVDALIRHLDGRCERGGRTSAVRVFVVQHFRSACSPVTTPG